METLAPTTIIDLINSALLQADGISSSTIQELDAALKKLKPLQNGLLTIMAVAPSEPSNDNRNKVSTGSTKKKGTKRHSSSKEDNKGRPKRPLSAYNLFFRDERVKITGASPTSLPDSSSESQPSKKRKHVKTHGKIGFIDLAKTIGKKWNELDKESRSAYEAQARIEKGLYEIKLAKWKEEQKRKGEKLAVGGFVSKKDKNTEECLSGCNKPSNKITAVDKIQKECMKTSTSFIPKECNRRFSIESSSLASFVASTWQHGKDTTNQGKSTESRTSFSDPFGAFPLAQHAQQGCICVDTNTSQEDTDIESAIQTILSDDEVDSIFNDDDNTLQVKQEDVANLMEIPSYPWTKTELHPSLLQEESQQNQNQIDKDELLFDSLIDSVLVENNGGKEEQIRSDIQISIITNDDMIMKNLEHSGASSSFGGGLDDLEPIPIGNGTTCDSRKFSF